MALSAASPIFGALAKEFTPLSVTLDLSQARRTQRPRSINLGQFTRDQLAAAAWSRPMSARCFVARMRTDQLWRWIHHRGVTDFGQMTNVAKETRAKLADRFTLGRPEVVERLVSRDGTRKWLTRFAPGVEAETVYIPDVGRAGALLCVSSQVGRTLNCTFCHTGTPGAGAQPDGRRDHGPGTDRAVTTSANGRPACEDRKLSNVVFMGMGEPLYNLVNGLPRRWT